MIIELEHKVGRVMVPLNRAAKGNHIFLTMGRPLVVRCHAFCRCLQRGKVMGMRYPGPVSRHNLVDLLLLWYPVPIWNYLFAMTVVVLPLVGSVTHE